MSFESFDSIIMMIDEIDNYHLSPTADLKKSSTMSGSSGARWMLTWAYPSASGKSTNLTAASGLAGSLSFPLRDSTNA